MVINPLYKNQFQKLLESKAIGSSFGNPSYRQSNLSGDLIMASGNMTADEFNRWRQSNPSSDEELQAKGVALVTELDNLFERFRVAHGEAVGLASAVQTLDPSETVMLGNYFMNIINGLAESHDKLKEQYSAALNRTPYTHIEDFIDLIPKVTSVVNSMESFRNQLRESVGDPEKVKDLAKKTGSEGTLDQIGSIVKWAAIGGIAFIVLKTFLPDIRNLITKKSRA